jgi:hypothetical protein
MISQTPILDTGIPARNRTSIRTQRKPNRQIGTSTHCNKNNRQTINRRPGRFYKQSELDEENLFNNYGDSIYTKPPNTVRLLFQNVKGLTYSATGEDYEYYLSNIQQLQVEIAGFSETNSPWHHHHIKSEFIHRVRKFFPLSKTVFGSPTPAIDPIPAYEKFQAGGNALLVTGQLTTTIHRSVIEDPSGLGRWTGITVTGKQERKISMIVGYRCCKGTIKAAGLGTTYHREYAYLSSIKVKSPNPRKAYLQDLESTINNLRHLGHAIIVMMDANETLSNETDLGKWRNRLELVDLHRHHPAPSTYIGSNKRRIDFIFGCPRVNEHVKAAGTLSYQEGPQSDHRSLFVDIDFAALLQYDPGKNPIVSPKSRNLRASNPELVAAYHQAMLSYYADHGMERRIQDLFQNFTTMSNDNIRIALEAWDRDQGRAMKHAESVIAKPRRPYAWSPELRNAGILKRYWRLRLIESITPTANYEVAIQRLQNKIRQSDPSFCLPHLNTPMTAEEVRRKLNSATRHLRKIQQSATENRFKAYQDLLALYQSDTNPDTSKESSRKAKIVKRTIRTEKIRDMFRKIRHTVKGVLPHQQTGLSHLKIPVLPESGKSNPHPEEFQDYIARTKSHDIEWETVIDRDSIEKYLLGYNHQSFRAASQSPCGHGIIYDALTFTSLTDMGRQLLAGNIPEEWHGNDISLRNFLASFMIPDAIKLRPDIKTTMSDEDIRRGISKWKESTSTSPSGRHLGHYKALIQDTTLLTCMTQFMHVAIKSGISISRWSNAINVMLEKDAGSPHIHRLRIIHLFEADFNLYMKLQWGKRLVRRAVKHKLLNPGQFGSVPGHTAIEPIMLTQLTNDNCRILRKNLARFDNDASACFDRIIVPLAMMAARRCGMSEASVRIHAETLESMKYSVKTQFGISTKSYSGSASAPLLWHWPRKWGISSSMVVTSCAHYEHHGQSYK